MQDRYLCCLPYLFIGPAVPPTLLILESPLITTPVIHLWKGKVAMFSFYRLHLTSMVTQVQTIELQTAERKQISSKAPAMLCTRRDKLVTVLSKETLAQRIVKPAHKHRVRPFIIRTCSFAELAFEMLFISVVQVTGWFQQNLSTNERFHGDISLY